MRVVISSQVLFTGTTLGGGCRPVTMDIKVVENADKRLTGMLRASHGFLAVTLEIQATSMAHLMGWTNVYTARAISNGLLINNDAVLEALNRDIAGIIRHAATLSGERDRTDEDRDRTMPIPPEVIAAVRAQSGLGL